jgi:DNA-binding NarL/FixJ family response regulator
MLTAMSDCESPDLERAADEVGAARTIGIVIADDHANGLSGREVDVLRTIALGHTNAEIADELYLSVRTVETHRAHIQQKLRLGSRSELVRYALAHRLIQAAD